MQYIGCSHCYLPERYRHNALRNGSSFILACNSKMQYEPKVYSVQSR